MTSSIPWQGRSWNRLNMKIALDADLRGVHQAPFRIDADADLGQPPLHFPEPTRDLQAVAAARRLKLDGHVVGLREQERLSAAGAVAASDGAVTAPMPGTVTVVHAAVGDEVAAGTPLLVVEAMKMEHVLAAPIAGTVTELGVTAGQTVALDERVALVTPAAAPEQQEN